MIGNLVTRFTLITLAVGACSGSPEPAVPRDDAAKALEQARSLAKDLAISSQNYQQVRFVSDIEKVRQPKPVTEPKPEEVVVKGTDSVQVDPLPVPAPVTEPEAPPVTAQDTATEVASAPTVPSIIPRDAPVPDAVGRGRARGPDAGPDWGTVIGVVIRGGVLGDKCERHRPPVGTIPRRNPRR
jgi:hypothetical protein